MGMGGTMGMCHCELKGMAFRHFSLGLAIGCRIYFLEPHNAELRKYTCTMRMGLTLCDVSMLSAPFSLMFTFTVIFGRYNQHIFVYGLIFSFQVFMGIGSELVAPNLMASQCLDGERLSKLFSQKTVWILPSVEIQVCHCCFLKVIFQRSISH